MVLQPGAYNDVQWERINDLTELRRRLVESERKRTIELQQLVSADKVKTLVEALLESVRRNVPDRLAPRLTFCA